ncbi:hypothetical protein DFH11DRAFT_1880295 [Phellopilus nigrolimitatus]|nr:hypothetical protein DFH11DRAFT_1880295 [Phellopilus nigrolimitatus]
MPDTTPSSSTVLGAPAPPPPTAHSADTAGTDTAAPPAPLHVLVVGGDAGALATALALARAEGVRVTLVNAGLGALRGGGDGAVRGVQLNARTVAFLAALGGDGADAGWEEGGADMDTAMEVEMEVEVERRAGRWKGKGRAGTGGFVGERLRAEGVYAEAYALRRWEDNTTLARQEFVLDAPAGGGGERVPVLSISSDALIATLFAACRAHPRIVVRPRAVVRAVLQGQLHPALPRPARSHPHPHALHSGGSETQHAPDLSPAPAPDDDGDDDDRASKRPGVGRRPARRRAEAGRPTRESFILLDDPELDLASPLPSPFTPMPLSPTPRTPITGASASLGALSAHGRGEELFSAADFAEDDEDYPGAGGPLAGTGEGEEEEDEEDERWKPAVVLTSGETIRADAVLGSEGPQSKVLDAVSASQRGAAAYEDVEGDPDGNGDAPGGPSVLSEDGIYRACIPISQLRADPELRSLVDGAGGDTPGVDTISWLGPEHHVGGFPMSERLYAVSVSLKGARAREALRPEDDGAVLAARMRGEVAGWCPQVTKLLALAESATFAPMCDYSQLEHWVSRSGRVAVLGDAAHPSLPFARQELSTAVDDALTLGALFASPPDAAHGTVPRLLAAYAALRRPRCTRAQVLLRTGWALYALPDGAAQVARDATLRAGGLLSSEERRAEWLHDPCAAVQRWRRAAGR